MFYHILKDWANWSRNMQLIFHVVVAKVAKIFHFSIVLFYRHVVWLKK